VDVAIRETTEDDLDFVLASESAPEAAPLVGQWSRERHREAIGGPDEEHLLILEGSHRAVSPFSSGWRARTARSRSGGSWSSLGVGDSVSVLSS
jgi:hypothetical protein